MRLTRAYFEGFVEGRLNPAQVTCPHHSAASKAEWSTGYERGKLLQCYHDGAPCVELDRKRALIALRRSLGERV